MSLVLQPLLPFPDSCQGMSPHQQGRGTKMTEHCYGGIDVSKDRLDVMVLPDRKSFSVDNNAAGYSELVKRLRGLSIAAIGIEPSGGYERAVIRALLAADLSVRRINPNKLRQFGRAALGNALAEQLRRLGRDAPDTEIQLRADQARSYGQVLQLMGVAQAAGLSHIGLVAQAPR